MRLCDPHGQLTQIVEILNIQMSSLQVLSRVSCVVMRQRACSGSTPPAVIWSAAFPRLPNNYAGEKRNSTFSERQRLHLPTPDRNAENAQDGK